MKKISALGWHAKRLVKKPLQRASDKRGLAKANRRASEEFSDRELTADIAKSRYFRPSPQNPGFKKWVAVFQELFRRNPNDYEIVSYFQKMGQLKTQSEHRAFAHAMNQYSHALRAKLDQKRKLGNTKREQAYENKLRKVRKQIVSALQKANEIKALEHAIEKKG